MNWYSDASLLDAMEASRNRWREAAKAIWFAGDADSQRHAHKLYEEALAKDLEEEG